MTAQGAPSGSVYDWFRRAGDLLASGNAAASLVLIDRVLDEDPSSQAAREIRARALFDSGRYAEAAEAFAACLESAPADDYAHYGVGISLWRLQDFPRARDHLAMASVMRPEREDYARALTQVTATIRARRSAGLPLVGPIDGDALGGAPS